MNAYIASFMLLLFNAVGLAVPASAATEERMVPGLGSAANLSEAAVADQCAATATASVHSSTFQPCMPALVVTSRALVFKTDGSKPIWAVVAMRSDTGDKLEHEEGAP